MRSGPTIALRRDLSDREDIAPHIAELFALEGEARRARLTTLTDELREDIAYLNRRGEQQRNPKVASAYTALANDWRVALTRIESIAALPHHVGLSTPAPAAQPDSGQPLAATMQ